MSQEQNDDTPVILLSIAFITAVTIITVEGTFDVWDTVLGLILTMTLLVYAEKPSFQYNKSLKARMRNYTFVIIWSLCLTLIFSYPIALRWVYKNAYVNTVSNEGLLYELDQLLQQNDPSIVAHVQWWSIIFFVGALGISFLVMIGIGWRIRSKQAGKKD